MNYDTPFYYLLLEKEGLIELGRVDAAPDCDGLEELVEDVIEINGTNDCQNRFIPFTLKDFTHFIFSHLLYHCILICMMIHIIIDIPYCIRRI